MDRRGFFFESLAFAAVAIPACLPAVLGLRRRSAPAPKIPRAKNGRVLATVAFPQDGCCVEFFLAAEDIGAGDWVTISETGATVQRSNFDDPNRCGLNIATYGAKAGEHVAVAVAVRQLEGRSC